MAGVAPVQSWLPSHLTRGAWIEIADGGQAVRETDSRTSHEVRGLKY